MNFISLGCAKNLVDTETAAGILGSSGFEFTSRQDDADVILLNTCSFIKEARAEARYEIERVCGNKRRNQKIIVCGCLPQLCGGKLLDEYPGIDALLGTADFVNIKRVIWEVVAGRRVCEIGKPDFLYTSRIPRFVSTAPSYAYIKIADGCDSGCSYCIIPKLRGRYRSRNIGDIVREAETLCDMGVKEIILVANDTTNFYCGEKQGGDLISLLDKLNRIKEIFRIRIMYMHPARVSAELVGKIHTFAKVAPYFDVPFQHTDNAILKRMGRPPFEVSLRVIDLIRKTIPEAVIRSTFITGFPGETEAKFEKMRNDVKKIKLDWAGVFAYSDEKGSPSSGFKGKVSRPEVLRRASALAEGVKKITFAKNSSYAGKTFKAVTDSPFTARAYFQAPEIDGEIKLLKRRRPGTVEKIKIMKADGYDLLAE